MSGFPGSSCRKRNRVFLGKRCPCREGAKQDQPSHGAKHPIAPTSRLAQSNSVFFFSWLKPLLTWKQRGKAAFTGIIRHQLFWGAALFLRLPLHLTSIYTDKYNDVQALKMSMLLLYPHRKPRHYPRMTGCHPSQNGFISGIVPALTMFFCKLSLQAAETRTAARPLRRAASAKGPSIRNAS